MAGTTIEIDLDDAEVRRALEKLIDRGRRLRPALLEIGEHMQRSVDERFRAERDPDGREWPALSGFTQANKPNNAILTERGNLRRSINYRVGDTSVEQGTNEVYAAIHQFGGTIRPRNADGLLIGSPAGEQRLVQSVDIPARPFLGVSDDDQRAVLEILLRHLEVGR